MSKYCIRDLVYLVKEADDVNGMPNVSPSESTPTTTQNTADLLKSK